MRGMGPYLCFIKIFYILAAAMYTMLLHFTFFIICGGCTTGSCNAVTAILEFKNIKSHRSVGGRRKLSAYAIGSYQLN